MIQRLFKWGLVFFFCLQWKAQALSQITVKVDSAFKDETIIISFRDSSYMSKIDGKGIANFVIKKNLKNGYAVLYAPRSIHNFYLITDSSQSISLLAPSSINFEGAGKEINQYLNGNFVSSLHLPYQEDVVTFIEAWKNVSPKMLKHLDSYSFPDSFVFLERKRINYQVCNMLLAYPLYHSRYTKKDENVYEDSFYKELEICLQEDSLANELWEYRQFYRDWLELSANRLCTDGTSFDKLRWRLDYIDRYIKDSELCDYLVHEAMLTHLRYVGVEKMDTMLPFYDKKVKNLSRRHEFYQMYKKYVQLQPKGLAPSFMLSDIEGNKVNLNQFLGNYVYIDVWASWCKPCCKELPKLKELEERFKGKPIRFISVSIDNNVVDWKRKVEQEGLKGILLHAEPGNSFRKDYNVTLIPHFILLDKQGYFINPRMTRPSDPETCKLLEFLLENK